MKNILTFGSILLFFLFINESCTPKIDPSPTQPTEIVNDGCLDKNKISKNACAEIYDPVCGCNDKTYSNDCSAKNAGLLKWEKGKCEDRCIDKNKVDPNKGCNKNYDPVCGCNGKTYGNECMAEKEGIQKWTAGKCPPTNADGCIDPSKVRSVACPDNYDPVCGCNGKTYPNMCNAKAAGLLSWKKGECK